MKRNGIIAVLAAITVSGCNSTPVAENAASLSVDFSWTEKSGCSRISPPIKISNVPTGTRYLKVKMVDIDLPSYNHGGGDIPYTGDATIPEGALKYFDGPCPPTPHTYEISVQALNADKSLVLGQGKATRKYPTP